MRRTRSEVPVPDGFSALTLPKTAVEALQLGAAGLSGERFELEEIAGAWANMLSWLHSKKENMRSSGGLTAEGQFGRYRAVPGR